MEQTGIQVRDEDITVLTKQVDCGSRLGLLRLSPVPRDSLDIFWPGVLPQLKAAMNKTDEATAEDLIDFLLDGRAQLLVEYLDGVPQGCVVTMIVDFPRFSALEILAIAGFPQKTMMYPNKHSLELLGQWAKMLKCTRIQGYANESIARLWRRIGFKQLSIKVGIDL